MNFLWLLLYVIGGVLALALGAILSFAGYLYCQRSKYSHLPSPKLPNTLSGFFLGHIVCFQEHRKHTNNDENPCLDLYIQWYNELDRPGVFVIYFMSYPFVIVSHPENVKEVAMQIKNNKPEAIRNQGDWVFGQRFTGNGLASVPDYDTWKPKRKLYDHAFTKSYLKSLLPSFNECTDKLLEGIRPLADGKTTVYMKQQLSEVTLNVISKVAFGTDFAEEWNEKTLGLKRAKGTGNVLTFLINQSFKGAQVSFNGTPFFQYLHPFEAEGYREVVRALRTIGRDCIMKRIKAVEAGEQVPRDILSSILQIATTKETVNIEDLVDDFVTFYVAGQETTGNLLTFAIILIHQHPEVLCRLQAEVEEVLGGRTEVTNEDLEKLQYTEQILMETLRLYSPAAGVLKEAKKGGIQFPVGDHFVPEGSILYLMTSLLCWLPEHFGNPETFDPTRFNPENKPPSSFVYFPFSLGHRSCIGKHFAIMEAKLVLARLVQTFCFILPPGYKLATVERITTQTKDDAPCNVIPANRK